MYELHEACFQNDREKFYQALDELIKTKRLLLEYYYYNLPMFDDPKDLKSNKDLSLLTSPLELIFRLHIRYFEHIPNIQVVRREMALALINAVKEAKRNGDPEHPDDLYKRPDELRKLSDAYDFGGFMFHPPLLHVLARGKDPANIDFVMEHATFDGNNDVKRLDVDKFTALTYAFHCYVTADDINEEVFLRLIHYEADVNLPVYTEKYVMHEGFKPFDAGKRIVHYLDKFSEDFLRVLIEHNAKLDIVSESHGTPAHVAAKKENDACFNKLVMLSQHSGTRILSIPNTKRLTTLDVAANARNPKCTAFLISKGIQLSSNATETAKEFASHFIEQDARMQEYEKTIWQLKKQLGRVDLGPAKTTSPIHTKKGRTDDNLETQKNYDSTLDLDYH